MHVRGITRGYEQRVTIPEDRRGEIDDLDPRWRDVNVAGQDIEAAALYTRHHRLPRPLDELILGNTGAVERGKHQVCVPASALTVAVDVVHWKGLDQAEADAVLGIAGIRAIAADVMDGIDAVCEGATVGHGRGNARGQAAQA